MSLMRTSALALVLFVCGPDHGSAQQLKIPGMPQLGDKPNDGIFGSSAQRIEPPSPPPLVYIYFGAGCFWHVQHELAAQETITLSRKGAAITAVTGYAGGTRDDPTTLVCYHNDKDLADYAKLGHTEVVQVTVPEGAVEAFAAKYFSLFTDGIRADPQDKGGEYRSAIGLSGGTASVHFAAVEAALQSSGQPLKLVEGKGDEGDSLKDKTVFVYDSDKFGFSQAELYHQFHDDFQDPPYGTEYNRLLTLLFKENMISATGCPPPKPQMLKRFPRPEYDEIFRIDDGILGNYEQDAPVAAEQASVSGRQVAIGAAMGFGGAALMLLVCGGARALFEEKKKRVELRPVGPAATAATAATAPGLQERHAGAQQAAGAMSA